LLESCCSTHECSSGISRLSPIFLFTSSASNQIRDVWDVCSAYWSISLPIAKARLGIEATRYPMKSQVKCVAFQLVRKAKGSCYAPALNLFSC
jgi:hypothetical protein